MLKELGQSVKSVNDVNRILLEIREIFNTGALIENGLHDEMPPLLEAVACFRCICEYGTFSEWIVFFFYETGEVRVGI